ncbi:MAG TPA: DUF4129 domain-containing protein [Gemmataceae bacterium]|nr:DUF4129 domain-containing protein [Gemmataceae bacterium]
MPSDRPNQTLADYVAIVISPVLIMGLVGSLVFFLVEVFYPTKGDYKGRLQWILFFFVFGAVLVGRISLTQGIAGRAGLYGIVLAGLTWIGMQIYVDYKEAGPAANLAPVINFLLVAVVWWCSHRLTHDCTDVHEDMEVIGEGLLQATGLENRAAEAQKSEKTEEKPADGPISWWERWQKVREQRKKKRVLGGWVVYFSLAALPLFGLGEALIPTEDAERRQFAFWLMGAYVACGLGLLATTCFLGLRRYLRQRRLQMPVAMTAVWLTVGGGLIAALLIVGALLPRPRPEYSLLSMAGGGDQKSASNLAAQGGGSGKGEGNRIGDQPKDKPNPDAADKNGQASGKDKGEPSREKDKGDAAGDKDKGGSGKADKKEKDKDKGDGSSRDKGNDNSDPDKSKADGGSQQQPQNGKPPEKNGPQNPQNSNAQSQSQSSSPRPSSWDWSKVFEWLGTILKWIVFALIIVAVVLFLLREGLKFLANFTDWAKNLLDAWRKFWAGLFRGRERAATDGEGSEEVRRATPPRPFSSFRNPFGDGSAGRRPIKQLVSYTFDALQAWAREHNVERRPEETPLEFAGRIGDEFPALEADVRRFASLYARAVYDYNPLPAAAAEQVRRFWERLESAAEQPMSA